MKKLPPAISFPVLLGGVFLAASLAPSMLPRPALIQGVISGISAATGYGIGCFMIWFWHYFQLPTVSDCWKRRLGVAYTLLCVLIVGLALSRADAGQNAVRTLMGMECTVPSEWFTFFGVTVLVIAILVVSAGLFLRLYRLVNAWLNRILPVRVARLLGLVIATVVFWNLINGLLVSKGLQIADRSFQELDAWIDDGVDVPGHAEAVGGPSSLVNWEDLGRQGRAFASTGPTAAKLEAFFGAPMPTPIRVYVGLNSASTAEERADLALRELIRVGGFTRKVLLLITPTGSGWIDPSAADTVEYLHRGDIASVSAQYSYLNSPLSLLTEADNGLEMSRALFSRVYGHWRTLPAASRPRLYLHGLSLGALNSDQSFNLYDIIDDPFHGALWSGPPFRTVNWRMMTAQREPGSPSWLPRFRDGKVVRFMNQDGLADGPSGWGPFRIVFLQYGSDPITFFEPSSAWREPDWMREPRAPDVSPKLRWFPVVTMLQVAADMTLSTAPPGFGHVYSPEDYIDAWHSLTEPEGWSPSELQRLKDAFHDKAKSSSSAP